GKENGVEFRGLSLAGKLLIVRDIHRPMRVRALVAPAGLMMAAGIDKEVQVKLSAHVCYPCNSMGCDAQLGQQMTAKLAKARVVGLAWRGQVDRKVLDKCPLFEHQHPVGQADRLVHVM